MVGLVLICFAVTPAEGSVLTCPGSAVSPWGPRRFEALHLVFTFVNWKIRTYNGSD